MSINYYQILGIDKNAILQQITKAYYKLALKYHPDRPGGSKEKFQEVVEAYEVLSNPQEQENYNNVLERGIEWHGSNNSGGLNSNSYDKAYNEFHDKGVRINEIFLSIYNFHLSACTILKESPHEDWVNRLWEIEFSEVENYKNQLLNFIKEKLKEKNGSSNVPLNKPDKEGDCCFCAKKVNYSEALYYTRGGNFGKMTACSSECKDKIAERFEGSEQKADQLEKDIQYLKDQLSKFPEQAAEIDTKIKKLEKELGDLKNKPNSDENQSNNQDWSNQNDPPQTPKSTPEQVKNAKDKLDEALNSNDKDKIVNILNETNETAQTSSDPDLRKKKDQAEDKLGEIDPEKLRQIIKTEVAKELAKFGIKADDLSSENKQKLDDIDNDKVEPTQVKGIRTEILKEAGMKALDKLITEIEQAIKQNNKKDVETKVKKLRQFVENTSDEYAQNAYNTKKNIVQQLLEKAKISPDQNNKEEGFFRLNNPIMWISGVAIIGLVVGAVLVIKKKSKKNR